MSIFYKKINKKTDRKKWTQTEKGPHGKHQLRKKRIIKIGESSKFQKKDH